MMVKYWKRLSGEEVESLSLEIVRAQLEEVSSNLLWIDPTLSSTRAGNLQRSLLIYIFLLI